MSGKKESRFLLKLLKNLVRENIEKYDVDALVRNMEVEVNTVVNQGIGIAKNKITVATKRFIPK